MIIYNVTVNIDDSVHDEWLHWMRSVHIPDVLATGLFSGNRMLRVMSQEESGGTTYSIQYSFASMEDFQRYEREFAEKLRADALRRYPNKFVAFRTLLEVID